MNDKKNTSERIDEIIDSATNIEAVNAPPFFKDKVLNRFAKEQETTEVHYFLNWLTPNFQFVALAVFILLNLGVLYYYNAYNQERELQSFAESYGLITSQESSILN